MNTQMERPKGHTAYDEDHRMHDQDVGMQIGHNEEHHGEKKSVLKKVKAKAKKIKDTIKEHVGHGHDHHDHDENDEEEDDMDADPEIHGTHNAQSLMPGQEGVARQHMHEPTVGGRTAGGGTASMMSKPGDYQTFDPTTARHTSGHDETLGWSRTDTGRPKVSEEQPFAPKNTPVTVHSGGHSTGVLDMGKKGAPVKLGALADRPVGLEKDPEPQNDVGEQCHPTNYMAKVTDPTVTGYNSTAAQSFMPGLHGSKTGEGTAMEGVIHAPASKPRGNSQAFATITTSCVPGQEETLACSGTDTGTVYGSKEQSNALKDTPVSIHSGNDSTAAQRFMPGLHSNKGGERTAMEGAIHALERMPQGDYQAFDTITSTSYVPGQEETLDWSRTDTRMLNESEELSYPSQNTPIEVHSGYDSTAAHSFMPGLHRNKVGEGTAMEGMIHAPAYQTFDPTTMSYVPGQEETLGWSRTDTGRLNRSEELSSAPENTSTAAHTDRIYGMGAEKERHTGKLGGLLVNPGHLEKDPHAPRDQGEKFHAENYQSKVTDPTGKGGEEIGVTPILHQLDRMHVHEESKQKSGEQESLFRTQCSPLDEEFSAGSHDQFSPEPVTSETSTFLQATRPGSEGSQDMSEQNRGSYTEKISCAAAMMADKAKQATNSVTSKLGYGGSSDQHSNAVSSGLQDKQSEPGGYGEKLSSATAAITNKAVQAKDVVASKLGYGGTHEGQPPVQEGASKGGSIVGTVKEKIAPVYDKVAAVGSNIASKVQGSGSDYEVDSDSTTGPSTGTDKGVSMKEYLVEKLKPGDEDKALSAVITEALPLHKRKEDVGKVREEREGAKVTIIGRVTESDEVAQRLGRSEETNYDDAGTGMASPGKGVMDRIKEAASTWFQKSVEVPSQEGTAEGGNEDAPKISST